MKIESRRSNTILNPLQRFVYDALNLGWLSSYTRTATHSISLQLSAWTIRSIATFLLQRNRH